MEPEDAIITTEYGDGVLLEEYKGTYSLTAIRRGQNDVNYKQWAFSQVWKNKKFIPDEKARPIHIKLGKDPMAVLKKLAAELNKMKEK
uniref:Uncharacterized protein n=1 Tax=viral metagenome TaxID=1070528 RepID=A0A6H1Z9X5_9ZZZZ